MRNRRYGGICSSTTHTQPHDDMLKREIRMITTWKRQWLFAAAALSLVLGLFAATGAQTTYAQVAIEDLSGAPVDIHSGSCEEYLLEPAYDAGDLTNTTMGEVRGDDEDEWWDVGISEDNETGAFGVDFNNDDALEETEVAGGVDEDVPVGIAEADLGTEVDTESPFVMALHSSEDQYESVLACGSVNDADVDDAGQSVVNLEPVDGSGVFGFAVIEENGQIVHTYVFQQGATPETTPVPEVEGVEGFPVGIHSGTCEDWTTEPAHDLGVMQQTDGVSSEEFGTVYRVDADTDFDGTQLVNSGPYVVAVHQGASAEEYTTLVACGPIVANVEEENVVVLLRPVEGAEEMYAGTFLIAENEGDATGYLWPCEPFAVDVPATPTPAPEPTPTPTVVPTAVIEETEIVEVTEVITVTEVVTETEVVPAPEATEAAEQEGASIIDLGEEPVPVTGQAGGSVTLNNQSDTERVIRIADLGIEETLPAGGQLEVILPDDIQPGEYTYEVLEDGEVLYEGSLTVE